MEEVSKEEKAALLDMLKAMMAFKPGERVKKIQVDEKAELRGHKNTKRGFIV